MALTCPECGTRISSKAALPGHYRRAHPARVSAPRPALAVVEPSARAIEAVPGRHELAGVNLREPEQAATLSEPDRLRAQYHMLQAMAVKLDAGTATDGEISAFHRALTEYNSLYDRLRAGARVLPEPSRDSRPLEPSTAWWGLI